VTEEGQSDFRKRISSVGWGTRESIQVLLGRIVSDLREEAVHRKFTDEELRTVVAFHDQAEALWRDSIATNPPLDAHTLVSRLKALLEASRCDVLGEFERRLDRGVRLAEAFEEERQNRSDP